jgi:oligoendopeptidase F
MKPAIQIPLRSEVPEVDTWDLTHIFKTEEEYQKSFSELKNRYSNITEFKGHLGDSPETLLKSLEFNKWLEQIVERLEHYSSLKNSEDSSNNENLSRRAELTNLLTKFHEAASYINPEIQAISDDKFQRFLDDPALVSWKISLVAQN